MEERAGCPREWVLPDHQGTGHGHKSRQDPSDGVDAVSFTYGYINPRADATPLPKALAILSVVEEEGGMRLSWMGMRKGVRGRADSLNFFEVIPSSLRENHLKNNFFSVSAHPHL